MPSSEKRKQRRLAEKIQQAGGDLSKYQINSLVNPNEPTQLMQYRSYFNYMAFAEALTRVKWHGLPDSVSSRFLEQSLYAYGQATITNIDGSYMAQIATLYNQWDKQGNFKDFLAQSAIGTSEFKNINNSVVIFDNLLRVSPLGLLAPLIEDSAQSMTTASSNLMQQRFGVFIEASKNNQNDAKRLARMLGIGEAGVVGIKSQLDNLAMRTINPGVEDKSTIAFDAKKEFQNEIHTFLGTDYVVYEKKERLVTDEAQAQQDKINRQREFFLEPRRTACEQMNKLFHWETWVEWNSAEKEEDEINEF